MSTKKSQKKSNGSRKASPGPSRAPQASSLPAGTSPNGKSQRVLRKDQDDMPEILRDREIPLATTKDKAEHKPLPTWYKVLMFGLLIAGLIWIIAYYILQTTGPVAAWGAGNIVAGFGLVLIGFLMMLRWR